MVLANSTWVRPAQALVYSEESGEVRHFPPRNRGTLPRALTFGDSQDCWRNNVPDQILSPFAFQQAPHITEEDSYFITSESIQLNMEDPPEEYESFEDEYFSHSLAREEDSYSRMEVDAPTMSTPTEQYVTALHQRKQRLSQSTKPQRFLSSASIAENDCMSPLLQPDSSQCLSLDDLVNLYSKKLDAIRESKIKKPEMLEGRVKEGEATKESTETVDETNDNTQIEHISSSCTALELMAFDIQMLLEKLDRHGRSSDYGDWLYVSSAEFESLLMNCSQKRKEFITIE